MALHVRHLPPGTSKWNKIEHRMFRHITKNGRGRPPLHYRTITQLIANTGTTKGLIAKAALDETKYEKGVKVTKAQMALLNNIPDAFLGNWNHVIRPHEI